MGGFEIMVRYYFYQETLFSKDSERCKKRLWKQASLSIEALSAEPGEGSSLNGDSERKVNEGSRYGASL
jgi:hypothetical protein